MTWNSISFYRNLFKSRCLLYLFRFIFREH